MTVRVSRTGDALIVRAAAHQDTDTAPGQDRGPWQFVRVTPTDPGEPLEAGPFVCAPTRAGLVVRFHDWRTTAADLSLH